MILKKYFIFGIVCLSILKVKSENVTNDQMNTKEVIESTEKVITSTESIRPVIEMVEQHSSDLVNQPMKDMEEPEFEMDEQESSDSTNQPMEESVIEMDEQQGSDSANQPMKVMELNLNDEDQVMLQNLNGIIEKMPEEKPQSERTRTAKSLKDENLRKAAEALTDEEITEIIKSISFPNEDDITEDSETLKKTSDSEVEPRSGRALRRHGYYIVAFTPIDELEEEKPSNNMHKALPYTRLQILPAERSVDGDVYDNPRFISKKSWNKYIRRIMRQIRKGTRKIQRKTKVKSLKEEPTIENFLKRMYKLSQEKTLKQQKTKKKSSWFIW